MVMGRCDTFDSYLVHIKGDVINTSHRISPKALLNWQMLGKESESTHGASSLKKYEK